MGMFATGMPSSLGQNSPFAAFGQMGVSAPFMSGIGGSMNAMGNLGNTLGAQFGAVNSMNQQASMARLPYELERQKLQMLQPLLSQALSAIGGGGGAGARFSYRDTASRQQMGG